MKCSKCGKDKPLTEFYKKRCLSSGRSWQCHQCKDCVKAYEKGRHKTWYREAHRENQIRYKRRLKAALIRAYGGKCACCEESRFEFLQLDHINGGGCKHRKSIKIHIAQLLKNLGYPKGEYRLLCANCNSSIGLYGYCPHQNENHDRDNPAQLAKV